MNNSLVIISVIFFLISTILLGIGYNQEKYDVAIAGSVFFLLMTFIISFISFKKYTDDKSDNVSILLIVLSIILLIISITLIAVSVAEKNKPKPSPSLRFSQTIRNVIESINNSNKDELLKKINQIILKLDSNLNKYISLNDGDNDDIRDIKKEISNNYVNNLRLSLQLILDLDSEKTIRSRLINLLKEMEIDSKIRVEDYINQRRNLTDTDKQVKIAISGHIFSYLLTGERCSIIDTNDGLSAYNVMIETLR